LKREWFEGKRVLDIGSGDGQLSLLLTVQYEPELYLGVDIDPKQVKHATDLMHKVAQQEGLASKLEILETEVQENPESERAQKVQSLPKSFRQCLGSSELLDSLHEGALVKHIAKSIKGYLYPRLAFRSENYISHLNTEFEKFDTVVCLGLARYIHLNFGDIGIKTLFYKVYDSLPSGGLFLLEVSPWKSYKKNKNSCKAFDENFRKIQLRPTEFDHYLRRSVGFELLKMLKRPEVDGVATLEKPIFVYQKP